MEFSNTNCFKIIIYRCGDCGIIPVCREVKDIATRQVAELEAKIRELAAMKDALAALARACRGDNRPDCPILSDLASPLPTSSYPGPSPRIVRKAGQRFAAGP